MRTDIPLVIAITIFRILIVRILTRPDFPPPVPDPPRFSAIATAISAAAGCGGWEQENAEVEVAHPRCRGSEWEWEDARVWEGRW